MYINPTSKHWIIDVEADDLDATRVWVVCAKNVVTKEEVVLTTYEDIRSFFVEKTAEGCYYVGHNIIQFDAPTLNRLVDCRILVSRLVDTFVLSMCYSPSLAGGHSLEAWGQRVGLRKIDHNDFSCLTDDMVTYCLRDVEITRLVFDRLTARMRQVGISERNCAIEHKAWHIINKQKKSGFAFDRERAHVLFTELRAFENELRDQIHELWPPTLECVKRFKKSRLANGEHTERYKLHSVQYESVRETEDGGYEAYDYVSFDLGSPKQRVEKLVGLGWEALPDERTPTGLPKPTNKGELVPSLQRFMEEQAIPEVKLIAEWIAVNGRANMIGNWLDLYNEQTGCIHGNLWLANTLRFRHDKPNTANIPRVRSTKVDGRATPLLGRSGLWTYEARDLWTTRDKRTRSLVGVDATGIQFRILAHYLNNEEFTNVILSGDIHEYNRSKTGLGTRDQNKTFGYAALLGAGAAKTGSIFGVSSAQGGKIKNKWIKTVPGLKGLYERLENELSRTGRISLCDGGRVLVSSPHMVLAYLLQGDESRIMKQAAIFVDERVRREGLNVLKVGDIHDEWQSDVSNGDVQRFTEICRDAFREAGESFNYNLPIECDSKVGLTWAETH